MVANEGWEALDGLFKGGSGQGKGGQTEGDDADGLEDADVDGPKW